MQYTILDKANPGRELYSTFKGVKYARYPVTSPIVEIGDSLEEFVKRYGRPYCKEGDIFCISAKVVSICNAYVIHQSEVKITLLARIIVKFVRKWPGDIGYSHPRKMQAAIDIIGYPRAFFALLVGGLLKLVGIHGVFYRIAGHNINAIDGFNPVSKPPMNEYAVLPPRNGNEICNQLEKIVGVPTVILDGNNIDNNVLGMSDSAKALYSVSDFMEIVKGNPQGQEDDGNVTPMLIIRKIGD